jgi:hypothetical protein
MKIQLRTVGKAFLAYLALTGLFGVYAEIRYRSELGHGLAGLGKEYVHSSGFTLEEQIRSDASLHRHTSLLKFFPPAGWIVSARIRGMEERVGYLGRNFARPVPERFQDVEQCRKFGFDPQGTSDEALSEMMISTVWRWH